MFKLNLKSKLIVAVMLIMGITAFMSCEKEDLSNNVTNQSQITAQHRVSYLDYRVSYLDSSKSTNKHILETKKESEQIEITSFINTIVKQSIIINKIDSVLLRKFNNEEISFDDFLDNLPETISEELLYNSDIIEKKIKIISKISTKKLNDLIYSYYSKNNKLHYRKNNCDEEYATASANNLMIFVGEVEMCLTAIEIPPLAAGCILASGVHYHYNQSQAARDYRDCVGK